MNFQITGLQASRFTPLFALSNEELAARGVIRMVADKQPGFPCRVSLRDAEEGETVLLLNHEHLPVASPYRSRHAIFVRQGATEAHLAVNEIPELLQIRLLSVRSFDGSGMMIDADVVPGQELAATIHRMLGESTSAYLHVHNAKPGCFAARVDRA
ncbi:MAG TPA: DUF1203 domain-containing protein [Steroidobacteraceae bacterium]|nr:DUF1203 domain-containing protein [Steroidobacteraceae bacterium]